MASRPEPGSFWGGRRRRRRPLDDDGTFVLKNRSRRAPNGRHDTQKNRMLLADFDVRRRTPRGGALFFVAAVFFGAVLFFFGGGGGDATIEESEVRARPNAEEDGGRRTQRRGLLAESSARGEKNIFPLLESEMPPPRCIVYILPFCFFARARDA